jgi:hypothetical protein
MWTSDVWHRQRMGASERHPRRADPDGKKILFVLDFEEGVSLADPEHC